MLQKVLPMTAIQPDEILACACSEGTCAGLEGILNNRGVARVPLEGGSVVDLSECMIIGYGTTILGGRKPPGVDVRIRCGGK